MNTVEHETLPEAYATEIDTVLWSDPHAVSLNKAAWMLVMIVASALLLGAEPFFDWARGLPLWMGPVRTVVLGG
ncbi:MAG: hypothetical protein R8K20_03950, partial [Gallionellaceae bacterium]